jgi:hypothetical protein
MAQEPTTQVIAGDGRISTRVRISSESVLPNVPSPTVEKRLIADGGGVTVIPFANIIGFFGRTLAAPGAITRSNFGPLVAIMNLTMEVEVEKHGRGERETRRCSKVSCHFFPKPRDIFLGTEGLLGMDQFDEIKADPVKSADGRTAYMARRAR